MRPCECDNCAKGDAFAEGQCWLCWLYHNDPRFRDHWDGKGKKCEGCTGNATLKGTGTVG